MNLIAAVDKNWGIGRNGKLLVNIPEDMRLFREETKGKVVIMGRKTFESLPDKMALKDRVNIVLTGNMDFSKENVIVCHSIDEVLEQVKGYDTSDVYVIGGAKVYEQMIQYCDTAHLTIIDYVYDADACFPDLDKSNEWKIAQKSDEHTYFDICYEFVKYVR